MKVEKQHLRFILFEDDLTEYINSKANDLYQLLQNFDGTTLPIQNDLKDYFINHHLGKRLFFSIQNSAHIIYQSVKITGKPINEINIVDYGAGLGTLYMLAGLLNFKRIVYNDYLPDWKDTAELICKNLDIPIYGYVTGDVDAVLNYAATEGFLFDIVASRNVIEHIYSLPFFYAELYKHNPAAVIFSTTSANFHNPAMRLKHYFLHKKVERTQYLPQRKLQIKKEWPNISPNQLKKLSELTRGKANEEFITAINDYKNNLPVCKVSYLRSNTCTADSGYWCEHLLTKNEYQQIISHAGFEAAYTAGYWDTHYRSVFMNVLGKFLNRVINISGQKAILFSPFVNVVASNKNSI